MARPLRDPTLLRAVRVAQHITRRPMLRLRRRFTRERHLPNGGFRMIYDYVVIGAGSAGCAVAARLAESGEHEVVLLEAGGPDDLDLIHVPAGIPFLFKSAVDWDFATEPQKQLKGRSDYAPR